ncbi:GPW/gp25 family protein [Marinigracilibium pacificum]|uniref:GPW/gp25 family protein n=1 Tax=Marinigracilibium pacificum TaxID=2729599 RepID=A0A848J1Q6_9BACT|nr:GPW/gp25 family protein [Marinigracilibium pacificum]NMM48470.1 GPW/gp25 family protein [Marinigracilibium pacificum]
MKNKKTFLGVGWKFPPSFEKRSGSVVLVSEDNDIRESLRILLSTRPGERIMNADYGCDLKFAAFEALNNSLIETIRMRVEMAVLYHEPRITLDKVEVIPDKQNDGLVNINLIYTVRKTNVRTNMVYPYYIIEGTDLKSKDKIK